MDTQENTYDNPIAERETAKVPAPDNAPEFLKGDDWYGVSVEEDFLDFTEPYRPPRYTIRRGDASFANVGDLHIISGKPGNGKTGLMTQLMATILCGKFGGMEYALTKERPNPIVLYIDTEQGKDDTIALKNRVCSMAGLNYNEPRKNFVILRLRDTESEQVRWQKILKAIYMVQPTDIFLDGMLDLVKDYNDQVECQPIIRKSMMLATHYDASLWMVLHENPLVSKLVGTLGSIAQRKVAEIFNVTKIKQSDLKESEQNMSMPPIYFIVDQVKARGKDVDKWFYKFTDTGGWGMPEEIEAPAKDVNEAIDKLDQNTPLTEMDLHLAMAVIGTDKDVSFTALRERVKKDRKCGSGKATQLINEAVKAGILITSDNKYTANPIDRYKDDNEMPF